MKNYLFGLFMAFFLTVGINADASIKYEVPGTKYQVSSTEYDLVQHIEIAFPKNRDRQCLAMTNSLKVPIYTVSLPDENKIVLVRDPKGFVERAIRHGMEYITIKPSDVKEYWVLVPVFSTEKSLSFNPKTTTEHASEEEMELLRVVPVKDFIRYN